MSLKKTAMTTLLSKIRENKALAKTFSPLIQSAMQHYAQLSDTLNNASVNSQVVKLRQRALEQFMQTGFPTRRHENWGYTNLTGFMQTHFKFEKPSTLSMQDIAPFLPQYPVTRIVMIDGQFCQALSENRPGLVKGVSFEATHALFDRSELVAREFDTGPNQARASEPFALLNTVLANDGFNIRVAKNTLVEIPIFVLHVQTQNQHMSNMRNCVVLEENAEMTLIQSFVSLNTDHELCAMTNIVSDIDIAASARFKQIILQTQNAQSYYFSNQFIKQARHSTFNTFYTGVGSLTSRHQNYVEMNGDHIETSQNSACYATNKQTVDSRTYTGHNKLHGVSQQLHKYVLDGQAVGVFDGMIKVARGAQKTDGQMDNKNLLLSKSSQMDSKPQLEIYADDVKCSHGSATGQIAEDQIFYLQARGIKRTDAIKMITEAFLLEPVETINHPEARGWITGILSSKLNIKNG